MITKREHGPIGWRGDVHRGEPVHAQRLLCSDDDDDDGDGDDDDGDDLSVFCALIIEIKSGLILTFNVTKNPSKEAVEYLDRLLVARGLSAVTTR